MFTILLFIFISLNAFSNNSLVKFKLINPQTKEVNEKLIELMDILELKHADNSVECVLNAMQNKWLREWGFTKDNMMDLDISTEKRKKSLKLIKQLGFKDGELIEEVISCKYLLSFSATMWRAKRRVKNMVEQIKSGNVISKNIVFLGGNRRLEGEEITEIEDTIDISLFLKSCGKKHVSHLNAADLNKYLWRYSKLIPIEMKLAFKEGKNLFFVDCDHYKKYTNPVSVQEMMYSWLEKYHPVPGHCHGSVEQPYGLRIGNVVGHILSLRNKGKNDKFTLSWQLTSARRGLWLSGYIDEIARALFHEKLILDSIKDY